MGKVYLGLGDYGRKVPVGLGYRGQNPLGFGLPREKFAWVWAIMGTNTRGVGLPWAKSARFWATVCKVYFGLGDYGHKTPAGLGCHGKKSARFGATMGKVYLGLGDYGHKRRGFGLPRPK